MKTEGQTDTQREFDTSKVAYLGPAKKEELSPCKELLCGDLGNIHGLSSSFSGTHFMAVT